MIAKALLCIMMIVWEQTVQNAFCKKIKELRETQKWNQEFLALRMGLSVQSVSKIESGITNTTYSGVEKLAQVYNVSVVELLILHNETNPIAIKVSRLAGLKQKVATREAEITILRIKIMELYEELQHSKVSA